MRDAREPIAANNVIYVEERVITVLEVHTEVLARKQCEGCVRWR